MTKVDLNIALKSPFAKRYESYIGGEWRAPKAGKYFDNVSPITGQPVCEIARSDASDVEAALDAAHAAEDAWGRTSPAERAQILLKIADRMEANLEKLALAETLGQRQADPRDDGRRHPARHRPFPLFRWRDPRSGRVDQRNRP
jgi:aldehyde dehydrogenase